MTEKNHPFSPDKYGGTVGNGVANCVCGLNEFHEVHYDGDRRRAADAYKMRLHRRGQLQPAKLSSCIKCGGDVEIGVALCERCNDMVRLGELQAEAQRLEAEHLAAVQELADAVDERKRWVDGLRTGVRVQVVPDHPSGPAFSGRLGTVQGRDEQRAETLVLLDATTSMGKWSGSIKDEHLQQPQITEPVPTFSSQEEADLWLERQTERLYPQPHQPTFRTQEEADVWLAAHSPEMRERWVQETNLAADLFGDGIFDTNTLRQELMLDMETRMMQKFDQTITRAITGATGAETN